MNNAEGILFVISGPSGAGKGSVLTKVKQTLSNFYAGISVTTRLPRENEVNGVDYYFITKEEFEELKETGGLYEYVETEWASYGTPKKSVTENLERGVDVILEIETTGAEKVRGCGKCVTVFVAPPSMEELKKRLETRNTESKAVIDSRLEKCKREMPCMPGYDYVVVNDDLEECAEKVKGIILAERCKVERNSETIKKLLNK